MGCHFLIQCMKVKSESEVAQSCPTLSDPMDCNLPGSSGHGIFPGKSMGVGCHCLLPIQGKIRSFAVKQMYHTGKQNGDKKQKQMNIKKLGIKSPYDPAIPPLGIYPEETKIERDTCIPLFTAALFTIARSWRQPRCPLTDEWMKLWYTFH